MTALFAVLTAVLAFADWAADWNDRRTVRYVTKPGTMLALIGVAVTLDPADPAIRASFVVGLAFSLFGDVFLLFQDRWFVAGLASFLLAHVAYIIGLAIGFTSGWRSGVGVAVVLVAISTVGRRIVAAVHHGHDVRLTGPVVAYLLVISAMLVAAFGTGSPFAMAGAGLFYVSDALLAWDRFVRPLPRADIAVMVTYHLGQAGLVAFLL